MIYSSQSGSGLLKDVSGLFIPAIRMIRKSLARNGIFCLVLQPEAAKLSGPSAFWEQGINSGLKKVFMETAVFLLDHHTVICASDKPLLTGIREMLSALKSKNITPEYFTEYETGSRMADAEAIGVDRILRPGPVNSFDTPVSAAYGLIRFVAQYDLGLSETLSRFYEFVQKFRIMGISALFLCLVLFVIFFTSWTGRKAGAFISGSVFPGLLMVFVFIYQVFYGDVFGHIGLLIAAFMLGTASAFMLDSRMASKSSVMFQAVLIAVSTGAALWSMALPDPVVIIFAGIFSAGLGQGVLIKSMSDSAARDGSSGMELYLFDGGG